MSILETGELRRNRGKSTKERGESSRFLDVMRVHIVSEAVHDKRGQEGEKQRKGDILLALQRRRVFTGKHNVWENTLKKNYHQ